MMTLFLTGCSPARERQSFETLQQRLNAAEEIGCDAQITAVNGDEAVTFRVRLTRRERETCAVVTDPESIRDIAFRRKDGEETLEFDGLILSFSPAAEGAAPCSGGIVLLEALADGYLSGWGRAGEYQTREILSPGGETVSVWFTKDDEPVYAEIRRGENTRLTLRLEHWEIKE